MMIVAQNQIKWKLKGTFCQILTVLSHKMTMLLLYQRYDTSAHLEPQQKRYKINFSGTIHNRKPKKEPCSQNIFYLIVATSTFFFTPSSRADIPVSGGRDEV